MESENVVALLSQRTGGNAREDEWAPIAGWPLKLLGELAETADCPDFLLKALRTRPLWRQAVNISLATNALDDPAMFLQRGLALASPSDPLRVIARVLPAMTPRQILRGAIAADPPVGLLGVLRKLGDCLLPIEGYHSLVSWHLADSRDEVRCNHLQRQTELDEEHVAATCIIDLVFLAPALGGARSVEEALQLNQQLRVIEALCSSASRDVLMEDAYSLNGRTMPRAFVEKWLRRADKLMTPFEGDNECRPVTSARELADVGRRFRNCLGRLYVAPVLSGELSVVEYIPEPTLALLKRLSRSHWVLVSLHAPHNGPVLPELAQVFREKLQSLGDHIHIPAFPDPDIAGVLRRVFGGYGLDLEGDWGEFGL